MPYVISVTWSSYLFIFFPQKDLLGLAVCSRTISPSTVVGRETWRKPAAKVTWAEQAWWDSSLLQCSVIPDDSVVHVSIFLCIPICLHSPQHPLLDFHSFFFTCLTSSCLYWHGAKLATQHQLCNYWLSSSHGLFLVRVWCHLYSLHWNTSVCLCVCGKGAPITLDPGINRSISSLCGWMKWGNERG